MENAKLELITAILVSLFGIVNVLLTVVLQPLMSTKNEKEKFFTEKLYTEAIALANYVSEAVMQEDFARAVVEYRKHCLNIHMLFPEGQSPEPLREYMEDIFRFFYYSSLKGISFSTYERDLIRGLMRKIRAELAMYIKMGTVWKKKKKLEKMRFCLPEKCNVKLLIGDLDSHTGIYKVVEEKKSIVVYYEPQKINAGVVGYYYSYLKTFYIQDAGQADGGRKWEDRISRN